MLEDIDSEIEKVILYITQNDQTLVKWLIYNKDGSVVEYTVFNFDSEAPIYDFTFIGDDRQYSNFVQVIDLR